MPSAVEDPAPRPLPDSAIPSNPPDLSDKIPKLTPPPRRRKQRQAPSSSVPETTPLPPPPPAAEIAFKHPVRRILSAHDHDLFLASPTYDLIVSFIFNISDSVVDTPISAISNEPLHPTVKAVISILDSTEDILAQCPPDNTNGSRFGNPAFRSFLSSVSSHLDAWHRERLPLASQSAIDELTTYYGASFGSSLRIDYGSGHELNFFTYLLCLNRLSLLPPPTFPSLALVLLPRYLRLMRTLQSTYYLEPAGSHGVWGLDDYHFLPFLFGAAQLAHHPALRPLAIHSDAALDAYAPDFLYLDMVRHVNASKTVRGLRWHSPMLDDISGVRDGWPKVAQGMRKMFVCEVLGKLVVMQHFLFGGLVPAQEGMSVEDEGEGGVAQGSAAHGEEQGPHVHTADAWGDCCGIKVPSSVGAVEEMRKRMGGQGLRRVPFD